jgi:hypothetical protein
MRPRREPRLRYDRIAAVVVAITIPAFTAGCVLGAVYATRAFHRSETEIHEQHEATTYRVAHDVAASLAKRWRYKRCPTPTEIGHPIDPWGHGYVIACADNVVVMSAGEDGVFDTDDDVVIR